MANFFNFLWAFILLYSVVAALLLVTGKAKPGMQVGYSLYGHLVTSAGALINGLGLNPTIGVIVILYGVYLHYKEMIKQQN
ncbi:hypothetical protein RI845_08770 [Thalassotalea nanhaiensis]|uniref:Uncharacterized protein n=1 Tax=Thalassotalea nanhaiensis TaxID=3065648 RepID=A0ABY9TR40_9GAMM|nr:hypothetical protein RI845_08770 [Colwelliaceae bacterium SQ345]